MSVEFLEFILYFAINIKPVKYVGTELDFVILHIVLVLLLDECVFGLENKLVYKSVGPQLLS